MHERLYLVILCGLRVVVSNLSFTDFDVHLLLASSAPVHKVSLLQSRCIACPHSPCALAMLHIVSATSHATSADQCVTCRLNCASL